MAELTSTTPRRQLIVPAGFSCADIVELETWFLDMASDLPLFMQVKEIGRAHV